MSEYATLHNLLVENKILKKENDVPLFTKPYFTKNTFLCGAIQIQNCANKINANETVSTAKTVARVTVNRILGKTVHHLPHKTVFSPWHKNVIRVQKQLSRQ